jgi:hypothetical protein
LIRLCGDGVVSNEARNGVILHGNQPLLLHTETDRSDTPPHGKSQKTIFIIFLLELFINARNQFTKCLYGT